MNPGQEPTTLADYRASDKPRKVVTVPVIDSYLDAEVGVVEINRPEKRNALRYRDLNDFAAAVAAAGADPKVRALVITGAGGAFCAGIDLSDLADRPPSERHEVGWKSPRDAWFLVDSPIPVVAAVDGPAVGMGAEIVCQADLRIVSPAARVGWPFTHRGLVPDMGVSSLLLPHIVGVPRALDLLFSGRMLGAEEAVQIGFAAAMTDADSVVAEAIGLARNLAAGSPYAAARTKALVYQGLGDVDRHLDRHTAALQECMASADHAEGVNAFLERRAPRFTGR